MSKALSPCPGTCRSPSLHPPLPELHRAFGCCRDGEEKGHAGKPHRSERLKAAGRGSALMLLLCAAPSSTCPGSRRCGGISCGCSWPTRSARRLCGGSSWSSSSARTRSTSGSCWPSGRSASRSRRSRGEGWRR